MDSQKALEQLESIRPDSDDLSDPIFAQAAALLGSSPEIADEFRRRQKWDASIGQAMRDVAVPDAARLRLLKRLDLAGAASPEPTSQVGGTDRGHADVGSPSAHSRRQWLVAAGMSVAAAVLACVVWVMQPKEAASMTLADVFDQIPLDTDAIAGLADADESDLQPIPKWQHVLTQPKVVPLSSGESATLYSFRVRGDFGVIVGVVAVINSSAIADPPNTESFGMSETMYEVSPSYATVSWTQGGSTYVCFFSPAGSRHELESVLSGEPV